MNDATIINLLTNSGLNVSGMDSDFIYFQDPSCIFPAFDTLLDYAWIAIMIFTGILIFGWGVLYIKNGFKVDTVFNNAKSLILILCTLGLVKPIVNIVYGDDLFSRQCEIKQVSRTAVNKLLEERSKRLGKSDEHLLYENFVMIDSVYDSYYTSENTDDTDDSETQVTSSNSTDEETTISSSEQNTPHNNRTDISDVVAVTYENRATIYIKQDGTKIKRSGGSPSWRNNNPGNIRKSIAAYDSSVIGTTDKWAVYPDEETGLEAITRLLRSKNYRNLTVQGAIHRWAPCSDGNNPENYTKRVSKMTGLNANAKIADLDNKDLKQIARAIQQVEGWIVGTEQRI